jgi:hypothetical protein
LIQYEFIRHLATNRRNDSLSGRNPANRTNHSHKVGQGLKLDISNNPNHWNVANEYIRNPHRIDSVHHNKQYKLNPCNNKACTNRTL